MTDATLLWVLLAATAALLAFALAGWLRARDAISRQDLEDKHRAILADLREGLATSRQDLEDKHRAMLADLNEGLARQRDRIAGPAADHQRAGRRGEVQLRV